MKFILAVVLITVGFGTSVAQAQRAQDVKPLPRHQLSAPAEASKSTSEPNEAERLSHRHYKAKDGHEVHSPSRSTHDQVPAGASAKCRDDTFSFSQHKRGRGRVMAALAPGSNVHLRHVTISGAWYEKPTFQLISR